jgi:hypothetical protein
MSNFYFRSSLLGLLLAGSLSPIASAEAAQVQVTLRNIGGANGTAFSRFFLAFHDGGFDPFNAGTAASSAIKAIAEAGNGSGLSAELSAYQADAIGHTVAATTNAFGPGIYLPGAVGSVALDLDPVKNRYLSYFAMVVPSNDRFFGNDSPTEVELFDANGVFKATTFEETGGAVWDAGTELDGLTGAAFVVGSNGSDSPAQNGTIALNTDFSFYSGQATPAGYNFTNLPSAGTPLLRVNVSTVPVPAAAWLFGSALAGLAAARRRAGCVAAG